MDKETELRVLTNIEKVLSEILSDKYDAQITITLKKEVEKDVRCMQEDSV